MKRKEFILSEVWLLATLGAFQRANIYAADATEVNKKNFKFMLKGYIENVLLGQYQNSVSDETHIQNILDLSVYTENFESLLVGGKLNFGVSQKLLNLYLKYLWCIDTIPVPPHFPVDSIIQKRLKVPNPIAWTKMETPADYIRIVDHAKVLLPNNSCKNLAELELELFSRN